MAVVELEVDSKNTSDAVELTCLIVAVVGDDGASGDRTEVIDVARGGTGSNQRLQHLHYHHHRQPYSMPCWLL